MNEVNVEICFRNIYIDGETKKSKCEHWHIVKKILLLLCGRDKKENDHEVKNSSLEKRGI